jgi:predicted transcriptional regulator
MVREMMGRTEDEEEMDVFELLEFLSSSTRRKILELLGEEDLYPFQLSRMMNVSPRIIGKYLEDLEKLGLISIREEKSSKGPDRRYASLNKAFSLIIDVGQSTFSVKYLPTGEIVEEEIKPKPVDIKEQETHRKKLVDELKKETADTQVFIKNKAKEIRDLDQKRKKYVEEINEAYYKFNKAIEKIIFDYNDREIFRNIFKVIITKPKNRVSLSELASIMRIWRGDLKVRIENLVEQIECINISTDRSGEIWYSI